MCLQWCHVHHYLIDNDDPCTHCSFSTQLLPQQRCVTCIHRIDRDHASRTTLPSPPQHNESHPDIEPTIAMHRHALCGLTHMALPQCGGCCHANVVRDDPPHGVLWLTQTSLAPHLIATRGTTDIATIFDVSITAPAYQPSDNGSFGVHLDHLALPEVYGVPADAWYDALGHTPPVYTWTSPSQPPESIMIMPLIDDICTYLAANDRDTTTRDMLRQRISALPTLSAIWQPVIDEALHTLENL